MGFGEIFTNACLLKAPLLICHNNDYGWWEIEEKLSMARDMGMNMWSEYYPYTAGSTAIAAEALRPESLEGILGLKYEETIYDPSQDRFLNKEEYLKVVKEDPGRTIVAFNPARKDWMPYWLKMPHMTVGSDSMWATDKSLTWDSDPAKFSGHPRTSGTHSTTLRMAREAGVPLMFTLSQLSYWSAKHLGDAGLKQMQVRGRMQEGMVADIVVFNPQTIREGSSYKKGENGLSPIGLPHLIVKGVFVKKDGKATNAFPGQPIRYPVEDKPRFIPATKKQWLKTFTIDDGAVKPRKQKNVSINKKAAVDMESVSIENYVLENPLVASDSDPASTTWFSGHIYQSLGSCCNFCEMKQ
ncbi:MAG: hypothetical protein GY774_11835 [Planctomycetes bacterium]|nr:hypothetical protein [Planctomycetota bacterium]